jgi:hypothetical protein
MVNSVNVSRGTNDQAKATTYKRNPTIICAMSFTDVLVSSQIIRHTTQKAIRSTHNTLVASQQTTTTKSRGGRITCPHTFGF